MIDIEIEDEEWTSALPDAEAVVQRAAMAALAETEGDLTILLTDDESVRALNRDYRSKDSPTNVLSFPAPETAAPHLGDIALSYGVCAMEARQQGKTLRQHLTHLTVHGVLHLLGYDHMSEADAEDMEGLERVILAGLGVPDPYETDAQP